MYIVVLILMLSSMGIESAHHKKERIYGYNATEDSVVLYNYISLWGKHKVNPVVIEPKKAPIKLPEYRTRTIYVEKGNNPVQKLNREYELKNLLKNINGEKPIIIIENDPMDKSGLKARAISREEFDKQYTSFVAGAPGGPAFPQEERKASAALNPDE